MADKPDKKATPGSTFDLSWEVEAYAKVTNVFHRINKEGVTITPKSYPDPKEPDPELELRLDPTPRPDGKPPTDVTIDLSFTKDGKANGFRENVKAPEVVSGFEGDDPQKPKFTIMSHFVARRQGVYVLTVARKPPAQPAEQPIHQKVTVTWWKPDPDETRVFTPAAPALLDFRYADGGVNLANASPEERRAWFVKVFTELAGFGADNRPMGRALAYLDAVSLAEPNRGDNDKNATPDAKSIAQIEAGERLGNLKNIAGNGTSSCAIFVRNTWRLLGVKDATVGEARAKLEEMKNQASVDLKQAESDKDDKAIAAAKAKVSLYETDRTYLDDAFGTTPESNGWYLLAPPYFRQGRFGSFLCMKMIGRVHGAARDDVENYTPQNGDCGFIQSYCSVDGQPPASHQHIFTTISFDATSRYVDYPTDMISVDGGQIPPLTKDAYGDWERQGDNACMSIRKILRHPTGLKTKTVTFPFDKAQRQLHWWVDITMLQFDKKVIMPMRGTVPKDPTDPASPEVPNPELPDWQPGNVEGSLDKSV